MKSKKPLIVTLNGKNQPYRKRTLKKQCSFLVNEEIKSFSFFLLLDNDLGVNKGVPYKLLGPI